MSLFFITNVLLVLMVLFLGGVAYLIWVKSNALASRYFFFFILAVLLWIIANLIANFSITYGEEAYLFWSKASLVGPALMSLPLLLFTDAFERKLFTINRYAVRISYALTVFILLLVPTHYNIEQVKIIDRSTYTTSYTPGLLYIVFSLFLITVIIYCIRVMVAKYHKSNISRRAQIKLILYGIVSTAILSLAADVVLPNLGNSLFVNFAPVSALGVIICTTYAIVAHRLFDIRVIIKRTLVYSVLLAFVLITYALIVFFFSQIFGGDVSFGARSFVPNVIAAIFIAFGFDPLKRWLQDVTDKYLFKGEYEPQEVANRLAKALSNAVNLDEALDSMMAVVTSNMRIGRMAMVVLRTIEKDTVIKRIKATGFSNVIKLEDLPTGLLVQYFHKNNHIVVTEELADELEDHHAPNVNIANLLKQLEQFQAAVALPLYVKNSLIGILMVSEKLSGDTYSRQDLDTLALVGSQTALSIEKARFYEEDKLKSEFISIASHELLTPTAAIEGYLSMALDEKMPQTKVQQRLYIQRAYDSSRRLADLVKDLLSISRIESGRMKIVPVPLDLVNLVDQAVGELSVTAKEKQLTLEFKKPTTKIPQVIGDPDRLMQVCINLINNSIKYTPKGGIIVTVGLDGPMVKMAVKDTGVGIAKADQRHLFEKFHRIDNPATAGITGTGLGLYIVKNIITLLGGKIGVESADGQGSTFWFSLPVAK